MNVSALSHARAPRRAWEPPRVDTLPRLTDLTLQTGLAIEGNCNGSTCF